MFSTFFKKYTYFLNCWIIALQYCVGSSLCPMFLVGSSLQFPPGTTSLSSKGQIQTVANQDREGIQRQGRSSQKQ